MLANLIVSVTLWVWAVVRFLFGGKPTIVIFAGIQGSGKTHHCGWLSGIFAVRVTGMGGILRYMEKHDPTFPDVARQLMLRGQFVPDEFVIPIFQRFVERMGRWSCYVFEGFPRNEQQVLALVGMFRNRYNISVIELVLTAKEAYERIRADPGDRGPRSDDTPEAITNRFRQYAADTRPALDLLGRAPGVTWTKIRTSRPRHEVARDIRKAIFGRVLAWIG